MSVVLLPQMIGAVFNYSSLMGWNYSKLRTFCSKGEFPYRGSFVSIATVTRIGPSIFLICCGIMESFLFGDTKIPLFSMFSFKFLPKVAQIWLGLG